MQAGCAEVRITALFVLRCRRCVWRALTSARGAHRATPPRAGAHLHASRVTSHHSNRRFTHIDDAVSLMLRAASRCSLSASSVQGPPRGSSLRSLNASSRMPHVQVDPRVTRVDRHSRVRSESAMIDVQMTLECDRRDRRASPVVMSRAHQASDDKNRVRSLTHTYRGTDELHSMREGQER
jgi:hypothetical protein